MAKEQQHSRTPEPRDKSRGTRSMGEILIRQEEGQDSRRRTVSFSSETPYRRYFGMEILDHGENAVNLERLNSVGVLLFNHDTDKVVGKVIRAWVENHRGMAEVEFDTDDDAEKIFGKVKSGTLKTTCPLFPCRRTPPWAWAEPTTRSRRRPRTFLFMKSRSRSTKIFIIEEAKQP